MTKIEQKYQIGTASGHILWNIGVMLNDVSKFEIRQFNVADLCNNNSFNGNVEYAMTTDFSIPLIIVELFDGKYKLIDGNHRLYKAMKLGLKNVPAYYLNKNEHICYIEDFDEQLYDKILK